MVVQKVISLTKTELEKQDSFSLIFNLVSLDINAVVRTMLKYDRR